MRLIKYFERKAVRKELEELAFDYRISTAEHKETLILSLIEPAIIEYENRFGQDRFINNYQERVLGKKEEMKDD